MSLRRSVLEHTIPGYLKGKFHHSKSDPQGD